jgi:hypothetical protein
MACSRRSSACAVAPSILTCVSLRASIKLAKISAATRAAPASSAGSRRNASTCSRKSRFSAQRFSSLREGEGEGEREGERERERESERE